MKSEPQIESDARQLFADIDALPITPLQQFEGLLNLATATVARACNMLRESDPEYADLTDRQLVDCFRWSKLPTTGLMEHNQAAAQASKWKM